MNITTGIFKILLIDNGNILLHHLSSGDILSVRPEKIMRKLYTKKGQFVTGWVVSDAGKNILMESTYRKASRKRVKEELRTITLRDKFREEARKDIYKKLGYSRGDKIQLNSEDELKDFDYGSKEGNYAIKAGGK